MALSADCCAGFRNSGSLARPRAVFPDELVMTGRQELVVRSQELVKADQSDQWAVASEGGAPSTALGQVFPRRSQKFGNWVIG